MFSLGSGTSLNSGSRRDSDIPGKTTSFQIRLDEGRDFCQQRLRNVEISGYQRNRKDYAKGRSATLPSSTPLCKSPVPSDDDLSDSKLLQSTQDSIRHRVLQHSEQLKVEQAIWDKNTVSRAQQHQEPQIKKVNNHASATISHFKHRLHWCHQQLQKLKPSGWPQHFRHKGQSQMQHWEHPKQRGQQRLSDSATRFSPQDYSAGRSVMGTLDHTKWAQKKHWMLQKAEEELTEVKKLHLDLQASYRTLQDRRLSDLQVSMEILQEQRYRQMSMEDQADQHLQDSLEERARFKQSLACTEEMMVFLSYQKAKEEIIETFQGRISRLERLQLATRQDLARRLQSRCLSWQKLAPCTLCLLLLLLSLGLLLSPSSSHLCAPLLLLALVALAWYAWFPPNGDSS